jgi:hypothetical protein
MTVLDALKAAAEKASSGSWYTDTAHEGDVSSIKDCVAISAPGWSSFALVVTKMADEDAPDEEGIANANFVALADPSTVLALVARLERAETALEPFALMSAEGVVTAESGHVKVVVCAEYFHRARAALESAK